MSTFFHGWRRKAGCVALVMACMFAALWLKNLFGPALPYRLQIDCDQRGFRVAIQEVVFTASTTGTVVVLKRTDTWFNRLVVPLPYWSITIPLTPLSAYLILWPRKRADRQAILPSETAVSLS